MKTTSIALLAIAWAVLLSGCASSAKQTDGQLVDAVQNASVTIYPALLWSGVATYDHDTARTLAPFIRERTAGEVTVTTKEIPAVNTQFAVDRAVWEVAADAMRRHIASDPLKTQLSLWPVYVFIPGANQATEIHVLLFNQSGQITRRVTITQFANKARTSADCTNLVMATVRQREAIYAPKKAQ